MVGVNRCLGIVTKFIVDTAIVNNDNRYHAYQSPAYIYTVNIFTDKSSAICVYRSAGRT